MKERKTNKKPWIFYYCIALVVILLFNALITPLFGQQNVTEVDYGTFLDDIESGEITRVEVQDTQIGYIIPDEDGKDHIYITGRMEDADLVNRLHSAGIKFNQVTPQENSPLLNFLLMWVLPIVLFVVCLLYTSRCV